MRRFLFLILSFIVLTASPALARPLTVLISIDGFRADYLERGVTPNMSAMATLGVSAAMRPSFPSKTFPNHYALITGLRPDRNGIVENNMEDPAIPGVSFRMSNHDAVVDRRWWDQGEPLWVSAEKVGIRSATMFWPGSEAAVHGVRPGLWLPFDQSKSAEARVDQVLTWADLPADQRPQFITLYFDDVDTMGHTYGPESAQVNAAATRVDAAIGRLDAGLKARGLEANIVVVADHGMAAISEDRQLFIEDLVPAGTFRTLGTGAFITLAPLPGQETLVDKALVGHHPHLTCWRRGQFPARFHYGHNPRVAPIFCLPETGWTIYSRVRKPGSWEKGTHGFDPAARDMAAVFVASGPAFKSGVRLRTFDNVDVYPLVARLAGIPAQPSDGSLAPLRSALKPKMP
ncbi:MAG: alkaline phosphatase family protein [Phenylobacterium zucineum]|nr:MAG: alkaline phosphatase family protein [Phenylobacterium zucineum]